ncbi:threonine/serine exporter family protein [Alkalicella caledoniensis]|uniref:Threonine/serine exporter family protein n=1 Tax=Alkalicella caledoniensis TaxID=2731377 RepID=A0A7G9WA68_ALKCA|nr:threonine/serine exporter family protein [Alkalicella caledoniensis]QNO15580.1 threonine/serine exporter family protein [Alkalicella caledoniensis]
MSHLFTTKNAIIVALYAGEIMLKNGAETYRVEETMCYILNSLGVSHADSFVIPTGIVLSCDSLEDNNPYSVVKRVRNRGLNLQKISDVNNFSRKMVAGEIPFDHAMETLRKIDKKQDYNKILKGLSASLLAASFSMLLGGTIRDFIPAFVTSLFVQITVLNLHKKSFSFFLNNIAGGFVAAVAAMLFYETGWGNSVDKTIIGSIMTLVPGVAITNAIRDSISGDLVSGTARAAEAMLVAIAIAAGVGIALKFWIDII